MLQASSKKIQNLLNAHRSGEAIVIEPEDVSIFENE